MLFEVTEAVWSLVAPPCPFLSQRIAPLYEAGGEIQLNGELVRILPLMVFLGKPFLTAWRRGFISI